MKMRVVFIFFLAMALTLSAIRSYAETTLSIGAQSIYKGWQPAWNNGKNVIYNGGIPSYNIYAVKFDEPVAYFMYGPRLLINIASLVELNIDFMYGSSHLVGVKKSLLFVNNSQFFTHYSILTSLDVTIHRNVKLFIACRSNIDRMKGTMKAGIPGNEANLVKYTLTINDYVPNLGFRFFIPVVDNFDIILGLGGVFLKGVDSMTKFRGYSLQGMMTNPPSMRKGEFMAYGAMTDLEARYTFSSQHLSLGVLGHYRILTYSQKNKNRSMLTYNNRLDHEYYTGIAVHYSFVFKTADDSDYWSPSD